jgi:hypothetical protein
MDQPITRRDFLNGIAIGDAFGGHAKRSASTRRNSPKRLDR